MIFKQGILRIEKIKFLSGLIPYIALIAIMAVLRTDPFDIMLLAAVFSPLLILTLLFGAVYLEWFYIYGDRIEVRTVFGKKNTVYYRQTSFVEETEINLTLRGMPKTFYIFHDGRNNHESGAYAMNSCYNKKKYNLRIYKTDKLEAYIKTVLRIERSGN